MDVVYLESWIVSNCVSIRSYLRGCSFTSESCSVNQYQYILMEENSSLKKSRQMKNFFNLIGLNIQTMSQECKNGDLVECFKSRLIGLIINLFDQPEQFYSKNVKDAFLRKNFVFEIYRQPYQYSGSVRSNKFELDQSMEFSVEKTDSFIKTSVVKTDVPPPRMRGIEVYAPRFLDEIADEIDTLENKKDSLFSRHRLRELLIPMLIVLKLFKLKLLLFLPLILSFASLKKFLGFMAIVIPALIGFFKLCKPIMSNYQPPVYTKNGLGSYSHHTETVTHGYPVHQNSYDDDDATDYHSDGVSFGQNLAYHGQKKY
ncbi:uncharacterized protein LOC122859513 isoform X2 [Aphidius gifuensis]|uniref:uncharacterized protein LOC122859513 isoform X2 n=1 Tax=Aphidius gifuensis TaxID=684658 RepID=UPI001CDCC7BB|nr:uncharacterized protein LOC122859513 isoform X2 [Aphidius gifuensis]